MAIQVQNPTAPQKKTTAQGTVNQITTAHCRVELPEHVFDTYAEQAKAVGKDPELLMTERLTRCAKQIDSGLHFNNAEKKRLELFLGHMVADAAGALQRLEPLSKINVSDVNITIDPVVLKRLSTRIPRGQEMGKFMEKLIIKSLRQYVGLEPY
jgi:hypothetical protein